MPTSASPDTVIRQIVDAMRTLAGPHPGFRPVHAKGLVCNVRSMAVKFELADGKNADILSNSVEGFVARTPEELLDFLRAQLQTPPPARPIPARFRAFSPVIPRHAPSSSA